MSRSTTREKPNAELGEISNPPRRSRVIVLEDDECLSQFYEMLIQKVSPQSQVLIFADGDRAWAELSKVDPDLLITDVEHPGLDAWEMVRMLAAAKASFPILMISGDFLPGTKHKDLYPALNLTTVSKPFEIKAFIKLLAGLLKADGYMGTTDPTRPDQSSGASTGCA